MFGSIWFRKIRESVTNARQPQTDVLVVYLSQNIPFNIRWQCLIWEYGIIRFHALLFTRWI